LRERRERVKEGSGNGMSLFMEALSVEPGGRAPLLGPIRIYERRLWRWAPLSIGAALGKL
jgi:hypothetical protein